MAHLILEQTFNPPLTDEQHREIAQRLDPCLAAYGAHWQRSYLSEDRKRMVCQFEAPDAEAVRSALRSADVPFDRVWASHLYRIEDYPSKG